ncbi:hypothetical protein D3C78_1682460 [compost metagenome]
MEFAPIAHPLVTYLSAFHGDEFIGAYLVVRFSDCEYEAHSLLMRKATPYSRKIGELLIEWVFGHQGVLRLTGYVREGIQTAVNHCLKMGFKYEGFRRDALLVNGEPKGIHVLGLTRKEWCAL